MTLPSLHPNVFSNLADNDASSFTGSSLHLHNEVLGGETVDLEMPKILGIFGESW
jgi:hypothetical protein